MMTNPFDYVKSIQKSKIDLIRKSNNINAIKDYNPYLTNKALSFYADSIFYANDMNFYNQLDKDQQYGYLINTVRSMNRQFTWFKREKDSDIETIMKYYSMNRQRARETIKFLSKDNIKNIKAQLNEGGEVIKNLRNN